MFPTFHLVKLGNFTDMKHIGHSWRRIFLKVGKNNKSNPNLGSFMFLASEIKPLRNCSNYKGKARKLRTWFRQYAVWILNSKFKSVETTFKSICCNYTSFFGPAAKIWTECIALKEFDMFPSCFRTTFSELSLIARWDFLLMMFREV